MQICFAEIHSPLIPEKLVESVCYREFGDGVRQRKIHTNYLPFGDFGSVHPEMERKGPDYEV